MYKFAWLGSVEYQQSLLIQSEAKAQVQQTGQGIILALEHPSVITLGVRGEQRDILMATEVPVIKTDRGGQATLHNPGQLVIYPILPFKKWGMMPRQLVSSILRVTKKSLEKCNIIINCENNGLFTNSGKITSVGLNLKGGVSTHGIAINVCNDLQQFRLISACGSSSQVFDQVSNYDPLMTPEELFTLWRDIFKSEFVDSFTASTLNL